VGAIDFVAKNVATLVNLPGDMATAITSMINDVTGAMSRALDALDIAEGMRSFYDDVDAVQATTATRQQQQANRTAQVQHVKVAALAAAARAAARVDWPSHQRAEQRRTRLLEWIEEAQVETDDPDLYTQLQGLRARLAEAVPPPDQRLPSIDTITLAATMPSLVLAHQLYGDAGRADDLVTRNNVRHPGFIPGGVELEYLSRGQ
jgi:prophage DNA circulation protein